jgi:flagellar basal-body rod protein FlgG
MLTQEIKMDLVSNNLANVNTNGYKGNASAIKSFPQMLVHRINDSYLKVSGVEGNMDTRPLVGMASMGAIVDEINIDFSKGALLKTDSKFDLAIDGPGFFSVQTPFGERLTRDGSFTINANNELVTLDGNRVMGEQGPIILDGKGFKVDDMGMIYMGENEDQLVDRLKTVFVQDLTTVKKVGHNLYMVPKHLEQPQALVTTDPITSEMYFMQESKIRQGVIERSNVNAVTQLRNMIDIMRTYEANSKVIQTQDKLMEQSITSIPRIG